jgi:hypothetical protein
VRAASTRPLVARLATAGAGVLASLTIVASVATIGAAGVAADARPSCNGWSSTTQPPDYIRVLRNRSGHVERVPFKQYVVTVMGKEWPSYLPQAVIDAGAVAVKQYAWFHALGNGRISSHGQCFDVTDGVGDQLYKPGKARVRSDHYAAINATWGVRLLKNGQLFMTGYRTGFGANCGRDATGWKLYARSASKCAKRGMGFAEILRTYYGPDVSIVNGGTGGQPSSTQPATSRASDSGQQQHQAATNNAGQAGTTANQPATVAADTTAVPNPSYVSPDKACAGSDNGVGSSAATTPVGERPFSVV